MELEEFLDACEKQLRRVEDVVNRPLILEAELVELDQLLRNEWPTAIIEINDMAQEPQVREKITMIFKKIQLRLFRVLMSSVSEANLPDLRLQLL